MIWSYIKNLFGGDKKDEKKIIAEVLSDSRAVFSSFGNNIYFSDFVNNCIDRIAAEISKIEVVSVREKDNSVQRQNDAITRLFKYQPNPLQTTKDFLASCEWLRRKQANCFIYPQRDKDRQIIAFYPLNPVTAELGHFENKKDRWAIKFFWRDGSLNTLPYDSVIHLKWRRGISLLMGGGDDNGNVNDSNTMRSLKTLDEILQGLPKMIASSLNLNGVLSVKTVVEKAALEQAAKDFESRIYKSESGIVAVGLEGEYKPVPKNFPNLPDNVVKFLKDIIRERYGVSEAILSGDYSGDAHAAFYQSCIEEFIIEFEQAFSERLFTQREKDCGNKIKCYYSRVAYFGAKDKAELATLATNTGLMTLNEIRELYGMPPADGGDRRLQSLNFVNTEIIDNYQIDANKNDSDTQDKRREVMTMNQTEKRSYDLKEFRAVENDGTKIIEGHAAVFEQKTDIGGFFFEVIDRGAFSDADSLRDVALFVNHNFEQIPLARSRRNNGNSTMTLTVDDVGLKIRAKLDTENNQEAKALYSAVERGDISGMSLAFRVDAAEWQDLESDMPTRRIKKISRVYEVSAATFPAYEQTDLSARAAAQTLENAKRALDNARGKSLDNDKAELEILKLKISMYGGK